MNAQENYNSINEFYTKIYEQRIDVRYRLFTFNRDSNYNEDARALLHISWDCIHFIQKECAKRYLEYYESKGIDITMQYADDFKNSVQKLELSTMEMLRSVGSIRVIPNPDYEFVLDYIIEKYPFSIPEKYFDNTCVLFEDILNVAGADCYLLPIFEKALRYQFSEAWYSSFRSAFVKLLLYTGSSEELYKLARQYINHPVEYIRWQMEDLLGENS